MTAEGKGGASAGSATAAASALGELHFDGLDEPFATPPDVRVAQPPSTAADDDFSPQAARTGVLDARALQSQLAAMNQVDATPDLADEAPAFAASAAQDENEIVPRAVKKAPKLKDRVAPRATSVVNPSAIAQHIEESRRPTVEGRSVDVTDAPTGQIKAAELHESLSRMRAPTSEMLQSGATEGSASPLRALVSLPRLAQVSIAALLLVAAGLGVWVGRALVRPATAYLATPQALRSGPSAAGPYRDVVQLGRGSELRVHTQVGVYLLVQDIAGHVGFVPREEAVAARPDRAAGDAYVDCRADLGDLDGSACRTRATQQRERCDASCGAAGDACAKECARALEVCQAECLGDAPAMPSPVTAEAVPLGEAPAHVEAASPATDAAGAATPEDDEGLKKGKRGKLKRKGKGKRAP